MAVTTSTVPVKITGNQVTALELNNIVSVTNNNATELSAEQVKVTALQTGKQPTGDYSLNGHVHTSTSITDFTEAVQDAVAGFLGAGSNITLNYNDAANTFTITAAGAGTFDPEATRDAIGAALIGVGNVAVAINDAADTITISTTATVNSTDAQLRDRTTHTGEQAQSSVTGLVASLAVKQPTGDYSINGHSHTSANITDFNTAVGAASPVQSVAGKTGAVSLVKADVSLGNVDNTSDANKPISTAQATAINLKQNALGYIPLNKAGDTITGDIDNTSTGFVRIPAGTTAQRPGTPLDGMRRYNTTTLRDEFYANGAWQNHARLAGDTFTGNVTAPAFIGALIGNATTVTLPINSKIGFFGDSISANGYVILSTTATYYASAGFASWVMVLTNHKYFIPPRIAFGVNGDTTALMVNRLGIALNFQLDVVTVLGGANDGFTSSLTTIKNLRTIYNGFLSKGTKVIAITILRRFSTFALTSPQEIVRQEVNTWILAQASENIRVINADPVLIDTTYFLDGLHPNAFGSHALAVPIAVIAKSLINQNGKITDNFSIDTSFTPNGILLAGTAGPKTSSTGNVANSFTLNGAAAGGSTVVGSKTTDSEGLEQQVISITGNYTGTSTRAVFSVSLANPLGIGAGDIVEGLLEYEIISSTGLAFVDLAIIMNTASFTTIVEGHSMSKGSGITANPLALGKYEARTNQIPINDGTPIAFFQTFVYVQLKDTGTTDPVNVVIKIFKVGGRIVSSLGRIAVNDTALAMRATDKYVSWTALTATRAYTLLAASSVPNQHFVIKDEAGTAATSNITFVGTVDGVVNPVAVNTNYGVKRIYSNGTAWFSE